MIPSLTSLDKLTPIVGMGMKRSLIIFSSMTGLNLQNINAT